MQREKACTVNIGEHRTRRATISPLSPCLLLFLLLCCCCGPFGPVPLAAAAARCCLGRCRCARCAAVAARSFALIPPHPQQPAMRLDASVLRYLTRDDFRVLTGTRSCAATRRASESRSEERKRGRLSAEGARRARKGQRSARILTILVVLHACVCSLAIEMGMKNHELVPTPLICSIAALQAGPGGEQPASGDRQRSEERRGKAS